MTADADRDIGDKLVDAWHHPKFAFLLGALFGIILVGSIVVSPPTALQQPASDNIGQKIVSHYQDRAPTQLSYTLDDVEQHDSGLYEITVTVERGSMTSTDTVYATPDGKWVFEQPPSHVQPLLTD